MSFMWHAPVSWACDLHCGHLTINTLSQTHPSHATSHLALSACIIVKLHFLDRKLQYLLVKHFILNWNYFWYIKTGSVTDLKEEPTPQSSFPFACLKSVSDPLLVFLTLDPHCFKPVFKHLWQTTSAKHINKFSLLHTVPVCLNEWLTLFVCKAPVGWHHSYRGLGRSVCWVPTLSLFVSDTKGQHERLLFYTYMYKFT